MNGSDLFSPEQHQQWQGEGFVVMREIVPSALIAAMRSAIESIIQRAAEGAFGDQFRWTDEEQRVPAFINDLLTPVKYDPAFSEFFGTVIVPHIEELLGAEVRSSWLLLLTSGAGAPYLLPLHRDNNITGGPDEAERNAELHMKQCYFQAPLLPRDHSLQLIPGSHLRAATEAEIAAAELGGENVELPGITTIELEPGDVVFRSTNTLHRGHNPEGTLRWTLVSGLWANELPLLDIERQDAEGLSDPGFVESLHPRHREAVRRFQAAHQAAAAPTA